MQQTISVVIVDDEENGRNYLKDQLALHCPNVTVVGMGENLETGVHLIELHHPDLVFLDIRMPRGSGFDLLNRLKNRQFSLIFTTAHEEYALKAFEYAAIDYLLKPVHPRRLKEAVARVQQKEKSPSLALEDLLNHLKKPLLQNQVAIPCQQGFEMVEVDQIIRLEADGSYSHIILEQGKTLLASKNLKEMERLLSEHSFFRVHQSHLINLDKIQRVIRDDGGHVWMRDGSRVEISRRKRLPFFQLLEGAR